MITAEIKETKDVFEISIKKMKELISGLLAFSRVESCKVEFTPVEIGKLIREMSVVLSQEIKEADAELKVDVMPTIRCNEALISQLFQNLIANAIKYQPHGRKPEIDITMSQDKQRWTFSVKDNGIGIPQEYRQSAFEIFKRLHSSSEYSGTGIGLAICKRIVEHHNGRIWIEDAEPQGTKFVFTISKHLK